MHSSAVGVPLAQKPYGSPLPYVGSSTLVSCHLFVLAFSPSCAPITLWEKSTFAFQSLANRRGLYCILMAALGLQGCDDEARDAR